MQEKSIRNLEFDKVLELLSQEASSSLGREMCLRLRPARSLSEAEAWQKETDDILQEIIKNGDLALSGFDDLREIMAYLAIERTPTPADLLRVGRQLRLVQGLKKRIPDDYKCPDSHIGGLTLVDETGQDSKDIDRQNTDSQASITMDQICLLDALPHLEEEIDRCIHNDEELEDRASPELYSLRRRINSMQEEVHNSLNRILRNHADILQDQLITIRGDRYVIPVKAEHKSKVPGVVHDSSSTGATVFIEPLQVVELNNKIREARIEEQREIARILKALGSLTLAYRAELESNQEILIHLDFSQAKARLALKQKAHRPKLNDQGRIVLTKARHPLIDQKEVVPIDFELGIDFTSLVITGPNTGGKTVSLKTCGLLTLMAMSGLQVPASQGSELSYFQYVLADIGDEQSIEQSLSTFSSHMKQIIQICEIAGPGTLVIADELGSGTDPSEGAALAIAILDYLKRKGAHVVASTHYQELKGYALNTPGVSNASCEFDSISMRPTYKLLIGVPGVSNAINISTRLGLQPEILEAAKALISDEGAQFQSLIEAIESSERKSRKMEEEIADLHAEAEATRLANEKERARLEAEKDKIINEARQEAYIILSRAELQAEEELKTLRQLGRSQKEQEEAKLKLRAEKEEIAQAMGENQLAGIDRPLEAGDLELGNSYEDVVSGFSGQLTELPDNKDQVTLSKGNLNLRVSLANLKPASKESQSSSQDRKREFSKAPIKQRKRARQESASTRATTGSELYLLGYRVAEAIQALDSYLDDAQLVGLESVRIVHGKGTGALRQAIRDALKNDKRVASFGDAPFGAGDAGVTIAQLK